MNAFRFELESVLGFKRQLERMAEMKVLSAAAAVAAARHRLDLLHERLSRLGSDMQSSSSGAEAADLWQSRFEFAGQISRAIGDADRALDVAVQDEQRARQLRTALATEVEALLTLRQQRWEEHQRDVQRADQIRLDEVSLRGWSRPGQPLDVEEPNS